MPVTLLFRTMFIGVLVAVPIGAMSVLCMERTLARGWRAGVATGAGIATADAIYAGVAASGVAALANALTAWHSALQVAGGTALIFIGLRTVLGAGRDAAPGPDRDEPGFSVLGFYLSALALTLANPLTILSFAGVFATGVLADVTSALDVGFAVAGVGAGSLGWWLVLSSIVALIRHRLDAAVRAAVARVAGAFIAGFGVLAILSLFMF